MYPYLTPYGIIMKINRHPLPELTDDIFKGDHEFWKQFSKRLTGDIIDYDTPVSNVVAFVEKIYLRRDFSGFKGDRKFIRDSDAQKSFSKLRSSIGGIYAWRLSPQCPPEYRPKTNEQSNACSGKPTSRSARRLPFVLTARKPCSATRNCCPSWDVLMTRC